MILTISAVILTTSTVSLIVAYIGLAAESGDSEAKRCVKYGKEFAEAIRQGLEGKRNDISREVDD